MIKYSVFESGKPAELQNSINWSNCEFANLADARAYAKKWLGQFGQVIPENWDGSKIEFCCNDTIEIRKYIE